MILAETTSITLDVPGWFYGVFSIGLIGVVFFAGHTWCKVCDICKDFPKIRRALDLISQKLLEKGLFNDHIYVSNASPAKLTEVGRAMLKESGFEEFFDANKKLFFTYIDIKKPKTPFDVEKTAKDFVLYVDLDKMKKSELVENFSYNAGRSIADILYAYSIEIRDRYLSERFDQVKQK